MNHALLPGPGDLLPIYAGHPHDPRTPEDDVDDARQVIEEHERNQSSILDLVVSIDKELAP